MKVSRVELAMSAIDPSVVSALSAVLGSVVGGGASIATAWFTQKAQSKREAMHADIRKRETIYGEFISECSKLLIDALDHTLNSPAQLVQVYGLFNRIRLSASDSVVTAAEISMQSIIEQYFRQNLSVTELRANIQPDSDPMQGFSEACRYELRELMSAA